MPKRSSKYNIEKIANESWNRKLTLHELRFLLTHARRVEIESNLPYNVKDFFKKPEELAIARPGIANELELSTLYFWSGRKMVPMKPFYEENELIYFYRMPGLTQKEESGITWLN